MTTPCTPVYAVLRSIALAAAVLCPGTTAHATALELSQILDNPTPGNSDLFGLSVSLDGSLALIGAQGDDTGVSNAGAAYLFDTSTGALLHTLANPSPGPNSNDAFGTSVSLSSGRAAVGAPGDDTDGANTGSVYVFDAGTGDLLRTLANPGASPILLDGFGVSVSLFGDRALIGAAGDDTGASAAGAAYLVDVTTGDLVQSFFNPDPGTGDSFGTAVSLFGDKALIGAWLDDTGASNAGSAYLFDVGTGDLLQTFLNPTPASNDLFARDLALSEDWALIGAGGDDTAVSNAGAAYIFDLATGDLVHTLLHPTPAINDTFGQGLAVLGDLVLAGAPFDDTGAADAGAAYLFDAVTGELLQELINPQPDNGARYGWSGSLSGSDALIAAHTHLDRPALIRPGVVYAYAAEELAAVPEPGTLALLAAALGGLLALRRQVRRCAPLVAVLTLAGLAGSAHAVPFFRGLGILSETGATTSFANGISADGTVVVGQSNHAFR